MIFKFKRVKNDAIIGVQIQMSQKCIRNGFQVQTS